MFLDSLSLPPSLSLSLSLFPLSLSFPLSFPPSSPSSLPTLSLSHSLLVALSSERPNTELWVRRDRGDKERGKETNQSSDEGSANAHPDAFTLSSLTQHLGRMDFILAPKPRAGAVAPWMAASGLLQEVLLLRWMKMTACRKEDGNMQNLLCLLGNGWLFSLLLLKDYYVTIRNHIVIQTGFRVSDLLTGTICKHLFGVRHLLVCFFPIKQHICAEI